jgi:hypothetical protein
MSSPADQVLQAYDHYRVEDQVAYYRRQTIICERALRRTTRISAVLLVFAALFGSLGAVDEARRGMWAFMAATFAALSTAIAAYEVAFGFERLSRQYADTLSALMLAYAAGPTAPDDQNVEQHVALVERLLRSEVDSWSHLSTDAPRAPASPDSSREGASG